MLVRSIGLGSIVANGSKAADGSVDARLRRQGSRHLEGGRERRRPVGIAEEREDEEEVEDEELAVAAVVVEAAAALRECLETHAAGRQ